MSWLEMAQLSVRDYYHSKYHKKYMKDLKKELKYLHLQEAHNNIFEFIKNKTDIKFIYEKNDNSSKVTLFEYNIYKIFKKYRIYWLINNKKKTNRCIETIRELLNNYFKSIMTNKFYIYHQIDYLDNYKCKLILKILIN